MTEGERRLLAEAPSGDVVDLRELPEAGRVVSPDALRDVCAGPDAGRGDPRGVRLVGARVTGRLDLSFCHLPRQLVLGLSTFDEAPLLDAMHAPGLRLVRCSLPGLSASAIVVDGDVSIEESGVSGELVLLDARVGGGLLLLGTALVHEGGRALNADRAQVGGGAFFRDFKAGGEVALSGATIGGGFDASGALLANEGGVALLLDGAELGGDARLRDGFEAYGAVRLAGARIAGTLDCSDATFANEGAHALLADGTSVEGLVLLRRSKVRGTVWLLSARIARDLDCSSAQISCEGGEALVADGAAIGGSVFLNQSFASVGEIVLVGSTIGATLDCNTATLANEGGAALSAERARIGGGVMLSRGLEAIGDVDLAAAKIAGALDCRGARFSNAGGRTLVADGVEVGSVVFLGEGFWSTGEVGLRGARIGSRLTCGYGRLENDTGDALVATDAELGRALVFRDMEVAGGVDLSRASTTTLDDDLGAGDDGLGSWSGAAPLQLEGFTYARFGDDSEWSARARARWLRRTAGFQQGAWHRLVEVYAAHGRDDEAASAAIAMHDDRVARAGLPAHRRAWRHVLRVTVGHGYRPWLAGVWAVAIIFAYAVLVWTSSDRFAPDGEETAGGPQPVAYAADTFLPIVDLGEGDRWTPTDWVRWLEWAVILLGWALTTIFVAGFTRIVRR